MVVNKNYPSSFRLSGILLGCFIVIFTAALFSIELGRLYSGSNNRGQNNSNGTYQYLMYPSTIVGYNGNLANPKLENRWVWPWSTATLLFTWIFFLTGILGIMSGQKESYSSILAFFICSILSICLIIFLIATYATIIAGWKSIYGSELPYYPNIDRNFSIACLTLSCLLFIIFVTSLIFSGKFISVCTPKAFPKPSIQYGHVAGRGTPLMRAQTPSSMRGTPGMIRGTPQIPRSTPRLAFN